MDKLEYKLQRLKAQLKSIKSVAIAYSSGVDSSFLLKVAKDVLCNNVIAVTVVSESFTGREEEETIQFCRENDIFHEICYVNQLNIDGFSDNPPNRCYICKKVIIEEIKMAALKYGIENVAEGSNMDDMADYRPGLRAIEELGILSPLREAGLYKSEIRLLSEQMGLYTYNKPSCACLASRFAYGEQITDEKLRMVEAAEEYLYSLGFLQIRVRIHDLKYKIARIEVSEKDLDRILIKDIKFGIIEKLKEIGFSYVTLDLGGYRSGSMNEVLK